ncbi:MAG: sigma-54-dependent Fis family transcriptional regulator [Melioribacteraceae bacterium]|nr:MAG: sigma-54-dependent Fis family transcriptional regulator [Melioribacteraceae bacterium]
MSDNVKIGIVSDTLDLAILRSILGKYEVHDFFIPDLNESYFNDFRDGLTVVQITKNDPNSLRLLNKFRETEFPNIVFVVNGGNASLVTNIARLGFTEIFAFPYEIYKFDSHINNRVKNHHLSSDGLNDTHSTDDFSDLDNICGVDKKSVELSKLAKKVAINPSANLILLGDTGTGKGVLAKAIHNYSDKRNSPFIDIICTAIPSNLLESELFGYEKGAFTDAKTSKIGLFELAEDGTIFLDEIADLSLPLQSKLLRAIEKKYFRRIGGIKDIPINARIISATNRNLLEMIQRKEFRQDLYYRLNVLSLEIPPLKERRDDIIHFAKKFLTEFSERFGLKNMKFENEALDYLYSHSWPGNIRELRHTIERSILLSESEKITTKSLKLSLNQNSESKFISRAPISGSNIVKLDINYKSTDLNNIEILYAKEVLKREEGNKSRTAKVLGISRPKLDKLLKSN